MSPSLEYALSQVGERTAPFYYGQSLWVRLGDGLYTNGLHLVTPGYIANTDRAATLRLTELLTDAADFAAATPEFKGALPTRGIVKRQRLHGLMLGLDADGRVLTIVGPKTWTILIRDPQGTVISQHTSKRDDIVDAVHAVILGETRLAPASKAIGPNLWRAEQDVMVAHVTKQDAPVYLYFGPTALARAKAAVAISKRTEFV